METTSGRHLGNKWETTLGEKWKTIRQQAETTSRRRLGNNIWEATLKTIGTQLGDKWKTIRGETSGRTELEVAGDKDHQGNKGERQNGKTRWGTRETQ